MSKNKSAKTDETRGVDPVAENENAAFDYSDNKDSSEMADKLEMLQSALDEAQIKRDDYLLTAQRIQAEFENFKKRTASVRAEAYDDGMRQLATDILPVIDNFERALKAALTNKETSAEVAALYEGVEMISKQLVEALAKNEFEIIDPLGEVFDPETHNAAMQSPAEEGQNPGTIVDVFQKGYRMKGKIIRYAMVRVAGE